MRGSSEYTKNTRSCTMTGTGHDQRLYNQYRSLPTTLYTFYTIMCESSEYTINTRSCTMTWTGHYRWLYKRLTLLLGLRSTGVGIWYNDHGRALPTVRIIVPSSRMVSVRQINPGFYIYTLERSFCLIINIMINIRYISRCAMQISKSVRFILHALSSDYRFSSVHVKNLTPTALQEDARARCRCERLPLNMHALSWQRRKWHSSK